MINMYDVIVIGAGPSGSSAAMRLAENGYSTLLLEKEKLPRYKPCGGAISPEVISDLNLPDNLIERKFDQLNLYLGNIIINRKSKGAIVWRDKFDYYITFKAAENGAIIKDSSMCTSIKKVNGNFQIKCKKDIFISKFVIVADGCNSNLLLNLGWNKPKPDDLALTVQYEMEMSAKKISQILGDNIIHLFFGKNICERGYGWIFPKKNMISVGWGSQLSLIHNTQVEFNNFLRLVKKFLNGAVLKRKVAHLVPTHIRDKFFDSNLFVVGDSAGFVDPLSGKGIAYAILSGIIAASTIIKHFDEPDSSILKNYYIKNLNKSFLNVLRLKKSIQKDVYASDSSILKFLKLWKNHRSSEIAISLWNKSRVV